jgi:hypothetical protein
VVKLGLIRDFLLQGDGFSNIPLLGKNLPVRKLLIVGQKLEIVTEVKYLMNYISIAKLLCKSLFCTIFVKNVMGNYFLENKYAHKL